MDAGLLELAAFHLTGKRSGNEMADAGQRDLVPALYADYTDLTKLRYDYPLVLLERDSAGAFLRSLSGIVDGILHEIAPEGVAGEERRQHLLRLEAEIRGLAGRGAKGSLSQLWHRAEAALTAGEAAQKSMQASFAAGRAALHCDGEVIDCGRAAPAKLLTHAWSVAQAQKARRFRNRTEPLIRKLSDILEADFMNSDAARGADRLKGTVGKAFEGTFDFEALSRVLTESPHQAPLPGARRQRIEAALSALRSQRMYPRPDDDAPPPHEFRFEHTADALAAFRDRLPEMAALVEAITVAELEIDSRYRAAEHDPFFERFDENSLTPEDLDLFPSYLVCLDFGPGGDDGPAEKAELIEALSSGLPLKLLVQIDDLLGETSVGEGGFALGVRSQQLAGMAVGLNAAFVLQAAGSNLYRQRGDIMRGLGFAGPALFSVFSGASASAPDVPPYLLAAAAMQGRAFPAFTYDPGAGPDLASRFRITDNPQAELDWPARPFAYEDAAMATVKAEVAFTFIDFVACDRRYARYFAAVPRARWHGDMIPAADYLAAGADSARTKVPYILMVDRDNRLHKVIVEDRLIEAARRCTQMWHGLQEMGGIHNSHARRLLEQARATWQREKEQEIAELQARAQPAAAPPPAVDAAPVEAEDAVEVEGPEAPPSDEAYIETPRCTTCNECTDLNNRMFAYNDDKQAYIADPDAGTYREMVEAAETCQVAIIHPGKPRNPDEPGLEELMERAAEFL